MNKKIMQPLAITALVLFSLFTVSFILFLFDQNMGNGIVRLVTFVLAAFSIPLSIALIWIKGNNDKREQREKLEQAKRDFEAAQEAERAAQESEGSEAKDAEEGETAQ